MQIYSARLSLIRKLICALALATSGTSLYAEPRIIFHEFDPFGFRSIPICGDRFGNLIYTRCEILAFPFEAGIPQLPTSNFRSPFESPGTFHGTPPSAANTFESAFNDWNKGTGNAWTLVDGGALDITFRIRQFDTSFGINERSAELRVLVDSVAYNGLLADGSPGPAPETLAWTRAIYSNFGPVGPDQLYHTLDTFTFHGGPNNPDGTPDRGPFGNPPTPIPGPPDPINNTTPSVTPANFPDSPQRAYADPIYPFQRTKENGINTFSERPTGFWDIPASFRSIALLSTVTFKTDAAGQITDRILTVYNGVNYGFDLNRVPEPAFLSLAAFLLIGAIVARHRRRLPNSIHPSAGGGEC